jgi:hypothetical protein
MEEDGPTEFVSRKKDMMATIELREDEFTAFPYSDIEAEAFRALPDDEMGRVIVRPNDISAVTSDEWMSTIDGNSGRYIQMRRADCGAGCRCATEVRIEPGFER